MTQRQNGYYWTCEEGGWGLGVREWRDGHWFSCGDQWQEDEGDYVVIGDRLLEPPVENAAENGV